MGNLLAETKKDDEQEMDRNNELVRLWKKWVECCYEARRAETAAREANERARAAQEALQNELVKLLDHDDRRCGCLTLAADKAWQAFQSNHTKGLNLQKEFEDLVSAVCKVQRTLRSGVGEVVKRREQQPRKWKGATWADAGGKCSPTADYSEPR